MQKTTLLMSLGLIIINSSAAFAAAPVLQLKSRDGMQPRAIDAYPSQVQRDAIAQNARPFYEPLPAAGARLSNVVLDVDGMALQGRPRLIPVSASYDSMVAPVRSAAPEIVNAARPAVIATASNDSLFYFLKNFKARPVQQPGRWTLLLVGLCFVLYQIRRRPMRAAIGFNAAARLIGGDGNSNVRAGMRAGGMANAVSV